MLPSEHDDPRRVRELETKIARAIMYGSPLGFVLGWVLITRYAKSILFLHEPAAWDAITNFKLGFAGGFAVLAGLLVFFGIVRSWPGKSDTSPTTAFSSITTVGVVVALLVLVGWFSLHPKGMYLIQEATKARSPRSSYPRNIVYRQATLFPVRDQAAAKQMRIGLIGSSQINLGTNLKLLSRETDCDDVYTCFMPGMVPFQYASLARAFSAKNPTHIVCFLSEFDFFREQELPAYRLRWSSDWHNVVPVANALGPKQRFLNRGTLADLAFAAGVPLWRGRDVFRECWQRFWWRYDSDEAGLHEDEVRIGAKLVDQARGVENARRNIQRTALLDANFRAFEFFAKQVQQNGARLIVVEGESHPDTMSAYPPEFREETRERLQVLAKQIQFYYFGSDDRQPFQLDQWRDAVHLNESGRDQLSRYFATKINSLSRN